MGIIADLFASVFRDYNTPGLPASGAYEPVKSEIRGIGPAIDAALAQAAAGLTIVADIAARDAFYATPANRTKLVYVNNNNGADDDPANGVYEYVAGAARLAAGFYAGVVDIVQPLVDAAEAAAETATAAAFGELLYVERSVTGGGVHYADIWSGELLPGSNRYVRTRLERASDVANLYDVWEHAGTYLAERVGDAFADIVQIANGRPEITALEYGKAARSGDDRDNQRESAILYADGKRLGNAEFGAWTCRTFTVVQQAQLMEVTPTVPGTGRARVRSRRIFTARGWRHEFDIRFTNTWSLEQLQLGNLTVIEGAGPTFDLTYTDMAGEDSFPPAFTDYPMPYNRFRFYGPLGIMLEIEFDGDELPGRRTHIDGAGNFSLYWKDEAYSPATLDATRYLANVEYKFSWKGLPA